MKLKYQIKKLIIKLKIICKIKVNKNLTWTDTKPYKLTRELTSVKLKTQI